VDMFSTLNKVLDRFAVHQTRLSHFKAYKTDSLGAKEHRTVAVGMSGGVDSAVAALLLKNAGLKVLGIFMRNWDEAEEQGNENCSIEADYRDAKAVCDRLRIPLYEVDFVNQYWNEVFDPFLADYSKGLTPNPDLLCNRKIKFGALVNHVKELGADYLATGHYARLRRDSFGGVQLLRGIDHTKDQSYFLASVNPKAFERVIFPLGERFKVDVRSLAQEQCLIPANKRSSSGICFIGRRNFGAFLKEYVEPKPGIYIDVDTGRTLGTCPDILAVTCGQRPGVGGLSERSYIVGKDTMQGIVYVAVGRHHPALLTTVFYIHMPKWLSKVHEKALYEKGWLSCQYKARYGQQVKACTLHPIHSAEDVARVETSGYWHLPEPNRGVYPGCFEVRLEEPALAITPQQMFVMYDGDICLGSAAISLPGKSLFELQAGRRVDLIL
jgi:tRNA (5-methylaminomethyl-2-thiouridylate)-methyltransferase